MRLIIYHLHVHVCLIVNDDFVHLYCSEKDKLKDLLIDSYCRLGKAQATVLESRAGEEEGSEGLPTVSPDDIKETYQTLQQWVDLNDAKVGGQAMRTVSYWFPLIGSVSCIFGPCFIKAFLLAYARLSLFTLHLSCLQVSQFTMMYTQCMKQYGRALKIAQKLYQEKPNPEMEMTALKVR